MSQYLKLIQAATPYANRMTNLQRRIFGDPPKTTSGKSLRVVKLFSERPPYMQEDIINYYPRHMEAFHLITKLRKYGLFRDEHTDFQEEMGRLRRLRGKVKPKKGEGKQTLHKN